MSKLFEQIDVKIDTYNNNLTKGTQEVKVNNVESVFSKMNSQLEYVISEDGKYIFGANEASSNKFMKITVNSGVNAEIYEYNNTDDMQNLVDVEIEVAENATVYYLVMDRLKEAYVNRVANVASGAKFDYHIVSLNQDYNENQIKINLNGEAAVANFKLITVATGNTYNKFDVSLNNYAAKTKADIWQKAVAKSGGQNEFFATGLIEKGCDDAENYQESRVLLLDEAAKGDASPLLLINHYNVLAGHAAGVSRVNEEELYYLQSRGITKDEAEKLMTIAFVKPLIDEIREEELQATILMELEQRLENNA